MPSTAINGHLYSHLILHKLQRNGLNSSLLELSLHILVHFIRGLCGGDLNYAALRLEFVDDWHTRLHKGLKTLLDGLDVVVCATGCFTAVEQALLHDIFGAVEEKSEFGGDNGLFEGMCLVEFTGEA